TNNQLWNQGNGFSGVLLGTPETDDYFGSALAWGDFKKDNIGDLAIGVRNEDVVNSSGTNIVNAGAVSVLFGSHNRLTPVGNQLWSQSSPGIENDSEHT